MAEKEPATIHLDGREFAPVSEKVTMAQDDYITLTINDCGAADIVSQFKYVDKDESKIKIDAATRHNETVARALLSQILRSGLASQLLAGMITEVGKTWTKAEADSNARIFAQITDTAEKVAMRKCQVSFVLGFFKFGEGLSTTSPKSSDKKKTAPDTTKEEVKT